jgi:cell division septation protein DedD
MNMTNDERKRSYSNRTNGWLATLAGAAVLVAVGFGVGLVAGTAYEEPELVAQHLAGQTTDVALGPVGGDFEPAGSLDGDVAAAPPPLAEPEAVLEAPPAPLGAGALDETREESAAAAPGTVPAQKPVLKPAAGGSGFSIQVGAFGSEETARQLAGELGKRGYKTYVTSEGAGARFKVRVGPIASRGEAERMAERLKTEHRLPTWILASGK